MHAGHEHGTGLLGEYFNNSNFTDLKLTRVDPTINFYWDAGSPAPTIAPDTFSVRWTGQLEPSKSEAFTLIARTDDGVRLWLDGQLVIDKFTNVTGIRDNASAPINLTAGRRYDVKIEYYENTSRAGARLYWSSPTTPREIIPIDNLFAGVDQPEPTAPAAPSELYARPASASRVDLTWTDGSDDETAFEIERSDDGGATFQPLVNVAAGVEAHADQGLAAESRHLYRVRAVNGAGASAWSNVADVTTLAAPQTPPPSGGSVVRVDAAGTSGFTDAAGKFWAADAFFTGGSANLSTWAVANTPDDSLYATRRTGAFSYARPVENGDYTLRLLFADWYTAAGQRTFNVDVEGVRVLTNFDIVAEVGSKAALVKTFNVKVTDGVLDMAFGKVVNEATLSAFELVPAGPLTAPAPPSGLTATGVVGGVRLTWQDNSVNEEQFQVERYDDGAAAFILVGTVGADVKTFDDTGLDPGRAYTYRVRAVNGGGASAYSVIADGQPLSASTFTKINWSTVAAAPIGRAEALHAVVGGKLYVFAGFSGNAGPVARSDVYDPATNTWTRIADMPRRLTHAGTAVDGRDVYFAGGYIGTGTGYTQQFGTKEVWRYNVDANAYTRMPDLPVALASGGLVLVGRNLHHFGGNNASRQDVAVHYVLNLDNPAAGWVAKRSMPTARSHMGYVTLGGSIYAIGGQKGNDETLVAQSVVEAYDPATDTWTTKKPMPKGVNHISGSTFVMGGRILTLGGQTGHGSAIADVYAYDPTANTWTSLTPLPSARFSGVAAAINGTIFFTGGSSATTTWKGVAG